MKYEYIPKVQIVQKVQKVQASNEFLNLFLYKSLPGKGS